MFHDSFYVSVSEIVVKSIFDGHAVMVEGSIIATFTGGKDSKVRAEKYAESLRVAFTGNRKGDSK